MKTLTLKERNVEELQERLDREPREADLVVKKVAEREAYKTIQATPKREYVPDEIVEEHFEAVQEELGTYPLDPHKELFREIFTEEIEKENMDREMMYH